MQSRISLALALALGLSLGACRLPNPDHCLHKAADANGWCAERDPATPFCSPCAEHNGCVAEEPSEDECPEYTAPAPAESSESESSDLESSDSDSTT